MSLPRLCASLVLALVVSACGRTKDASTDARSNDAGSEAIETDALQGSAGMGGAGGGLGEGGGGPSSFGGSGPNAGAGGHAIGGAGGLGGGAVVDVDPGIAFACGDRTCDSGRTFCYQFTAGGEGSRRQYACRDYPAECATAPTCACICPPFEVIYCLVRDSVDLPSTCACEVRDGALTVYCAGV